MPSAPLLSWSPDGGLLLVPASDPSLPSIIVPVSGGGSPADVPLTYD